jgi:hypothetical protein
MIQWNHMMSAQRLSDVRHSQLLGKLSFLPARRESLAAFIRSMSHGVPGFRLINFTVPVFDTAPMIMVVEQPCGSFAFATCNTAPAFTSR